MASDGWIEQSMARLKVLEEQREKLVASAVDGQASDESGHAQALAAIDAEFDELYARLEAAADAAAEDDAEITGELPPPAQPQSSEPQSKSAGVEKAQPNGHFKQASNLTRAPQTVATRATAKPLNSWSAKAAGKHAERAETKPKLSAVSTGRHATLSSDDARKALTAKLSARKAQAPAPSASLSLPKSAPAAEASGTRAPTQELSLPDQGPPAQAHGVPSLAQPMAVKQVVVPASPPASPAQVAPMRVPTGLFDQDEINAGLPAPVEARAPAPPTLRKPVAAVKTVAIAPRAAAVREAEAATKPIVAANVRPQHPSGTKNNELSQVSRLLVQAGEQVHALADQVSEFDQVIEGARRSVTEQERRAEAVERARYEAEAEARRIAEQTLSAQEAARQAAEELSRNEAEARLAAQRLANAQQRLKNLERMGELLREAEKARDEANRSFAQLSHEQKKRREALASSEAELSRSAEKAIEDAEAAQAAAQAAQAQAESLLGELDQVREQLATLEATLADESVQSRELVQAATERHDHLLREMERLASIDEEVDAALDSLEIERLAADDSVAKAKARLESSAENGAKERSRKASKDPSAVEVKVSGKSAPARNGRKNGRKPQHGTRPQERPLATRTTTAPLFDDGEANEETTSRADKSAAPIRNVGEFPAVRDDEDTNPSLRQLSELDIKASRFSRTSKTIWSVIGVALLVGFAGQVAGFYGSSAKPAESTVSEASVSGKSIAQPEAVKAEAQPSVAAANAPLPAQAAAAAVEAAAPPAQPASDAAANAEAAPAAEEPAPLAARVAPEAKPRSKKAKTSKKSAKTGAKAASAKKTNKLAMPKAAQSKR